MNIYGEHGNTCENAQLHMHIYYFHYTDIYENTFIIVSNIDD